MSKGSYLGNIMALALMAESFEKMDYNSSNKGLNKLNPNDIDVTIKQSKPAAGCKEYFFNKNGGFANGEGRPMRKDETVYYCHAINDKSAKRKFDKWYENNKVV